MFKYIDMYIYITQLGVVKNEIYFAPINYCSDIKIVQKI